MNTNHVNKKPLPGPGLSSSESFLTLPSRQWAAATSCLPAQGDGAAESPVQRLKESTRAADACEDDKEPHAEMLNRLAVVDTSLSLQKTAARR